MSISVRSLAAKKAWKTQKNRAAAKKAWITRKIVAKKRSLAALRAWDTIKRKSRKK